MQRKRINLIDEGELEKRERKRMRELREGDDYRQVLTGVDR